MDNLSKFEKYMLSVNKIPAEYIFDADKLALILDYYREYALINILFESEFIAFKNYLMTNGNKDITDSDVYELARKMGVI